MVAAIMAVGVMMEGVEPQHEIDLEWIWRATITGTSRKIAQQQLMTARVTMVQCQSKNANRHSEWNRS
jgi:hypothetical protein